MSYQSSKTEGSNLTLALSATRDIFRCTTLKTKRFLTKDSDANFTWFRSVSWAKAITLLGDNEYQSEIDRVFNTLAYVGDQDKIHHQIYNKLDPLQKGYVELEELTSLV